ncbi:acetyl-CoA carboxylase, carboxyltransferase subunit beta [Candidatus Legionella polyplacis]|uniref:Acetyl-coenzyme A carboxylase carboxyl transferase subunit beta n=1 Tax=Candidatus Legionella polyplacis TaxID=2005262 RepID=A0ABZ2GYU8_9GAMM
MNWFKKSFLSKVKTKVFQKKNTSDEILWIKCVGCKSILYRDILIKNLSVCPNCNKHYRLTARERLNFFLDKKNRKEIITLLKPVNYLTFKDVKKYKDRIIQAQKCTGEKEAFIVMKGTLRNIPIIAGAFEFNFMGGSMGFVVGEKFIQSIYIAISERRSFICFTASGGARMQEGLIALMQMARTSMILTKFFNEKLPLIIVQTDPTMGGVSASFASLGDIIIAEPNSIIGFTGSKIIKDTLREKLPKGFQESETLLKYGHIDMIVHRRDLRKIIFGLISKIFK